MARNREKESSPDEGKQIQNGGYSEKKQALDIEAKSGDLSGQKRSRGRQSDKDVDKTASRRKKN